jgi:hypothetical protein
VRNTVNVPTCSKQDWCFSNKYRGRYHFSLLDVCICFLTDEGPKHGATRSWLTMGTVCKLYHSFRDSCRVYESVVSPPPPPPPAADEFGVNANSHRDRVSISNEISLLNMGRWIYQKVTVIGWFGARQK